MDFPIRCRCGLLQGHVTATERAARALCYCRDCQAFARFLGDPTRILDDRGGTDVVATTPRFVKFTRSTEQLRCMSLSEKGLLRWYAECCRTPIGNTPRDRRLAYVGVVHTCLAGSPAELDAAFGPARVAINTASATGKVSPTPWATFGAMLKIVRNVAGARLGRRLRENPFFVPDTGAPIRAPQVVTPSDRERLRGAA